MEKLSVIKVIKLLDQKFVEYSRENNYDKMSVIVDVKKELFKLIELPF